ncbi:glycosyltransferase [Mucilaginibacter endophyticus]|uniref:glycosyltransferase n=1 Tax=Mucilaginibacter endophyticus TaxID=2675003 RepID=UPI000E0D44CB|nr:glycosyltransferase [Mucilaginibacter endophyticus]
MNLLFDLIAAHPLMGEKVHGGAKYTKRLFFELVKSNYTDVKIFALFDSNQVFDEDIKAALVGKQITLVDIREKSIQEIITGNKINRCYFALPYSIAFNFLDLFKLDCEVIITIHGLRDLEIPPRIESLKYIRGLKKKLVAFLKILLQKRVYEKKYNYHLNLLKNAKIVTVSNHSRFAIRTFFPKQTTEVRTFYSPNVANISDHEQDTNVQTFNESQYFLMVNGNRWLKNNLRAALALDELFSEGKESGKKVIITGVGNKILYTSQIKNIDRFIFYDFVSESFLKKLYQNAHAFIYLSLNEGFGYPPLDAMKYGVPVIASPFTSISEVCDNAALYGDPYSTAEIKNRILQLGDLEIYNKFKERGLRRYEEVSRIQDEHLELMIEYLTT